ncbi:hypothetical protein ACFOHS_03370 [Jhaorihella thermophila]
MTIPASLARAARNAVATNALISDPAALRAHNRPQMRRYDVMALAPNGDIIETRHVAPALPMFEGAFLRVYPWLADRNRLRPCGDRGSAARRPDPDR